MGCNQCPGPCNCHELKPTCHNLIPLTPTAPPIPIIAGSNSIYNTTLVTNQQSNILPGYYITSFNGGMLLEVGASVINPTFTATYSTPPTNAEITDTANLNTAYSLSTPFTSEIVPSSFTSSTLNASITFTLTALFPIVNSTAVVQTAIQAFTFVARSFGGVGIPGSVSATVNGNAAVLNLSPGTLSDMGLSLTNNGLSYGPFFPHCESIYILVPHVPTIYTFIDQDNLAFQMKTPITFNFTNVYGVVVSMDLYQSEYVLDRPFTLTMHNPVVYSSDYCHKQDCHCYTR